MKNEKVAKFFVGTLLNVKVEEEFTSLKEKEQELSIDAISKKEQELEALSKRRNYVENKNDSFKLH